MGADRRFLLVVLGVFGFGAMLAIIGWIATPDPRGVLWIDVAQTGIQLVAITALGAVVADALRYVDDARKEDRRLDEQRLRVLNNIVASYNRAKLVRRNVRALGLWPTGVGVLEDAQVHALRDCMGQLDDAQLAFEEIERALGPQASPFREPEALRRQVHRLQTYLADILKEWEQHGGAVWPDARRSTIEPLQELRAYTGSSWESFASGAKDPMEELERLVHAQLAPRRRRRVKP